MVVNVIESSENVKTFLYSASIGVLYLARAGLDIVKLAWIVTFAHWVPFVAIY